LVYADDVNILGGSVHTRTIKKKDTLLVASKEICVEVNSDKTKYMVMSPRSEFNMKLQYKD